MPAFSTPMAIAIVLLALGGLTTQTLAIATGRDTALGLIPQFDPSGLVNVPAWFASALLATCAASCALAALATRSVEGRGVARLWWCSGLLAVVSVNRLSGFVDRLTGARIAMGVTATHEPRDGVLIACGLAALLFCVRDVPRDLRERFRAAGAIGMLGWIVSATASGPPAAATRDVRVAHMITVVCGHALGLAGATLFLATLGALLTSRFRHVIVEVDSGQRGPAEISPEPGGLRIRVSAPVVSRVLAVTTGAILAASLMAAWVRYAIGPESDGLYRFLFVDFEGNLPSWYSSLLLLACAAATGLIARARFEVGDPQRWHWGGLALLFVALSIDEAASLHELSVAPLRTAFSGNRWLWFPLVVPGAIVFGGAWATLRTFLETLPVSTRRALYTGAGVFLTGALGLETVGGWFDPVRYGDNVTYVLLATLEEGCEMLGVAITLDGLLRHLAQAVGPLRIACASRLDSRTRVV